MILALGVCPAFGGGWPLNSPSVTLYTAFQQAPPAAVLDAIHNELEAIMLPSGLRFEWYPLSDAGGRVSSQLAVIHFKGQCDAADMRPEWGYPGALGWTHVSDGQILPFIDISCEGLRLFVQRSLSGMPPASRDSLFGRALGRILAHELYHLLARTTQHADNGLAKAAYSAEDLLAQTLRFGKKEYAALRNRGLRLLAQSEGLAALPESSGQ
ncbi:MAG: hypothetical protein JOZ22_11140 [Acidobacteriia bacterium]|nr:hypothetical protein [Terriglobia bacterium]